MRMTASKASKYSEKKQETYRNYQSIIESNINHSLEKVNRKDYEIEKKVMKKIEIHNKKRNYIRDSLS